MAEGYDRIAIEGRTHVEGKKIFMNNEDLYLEIINNMREGAYFVNEERKITFWSKAAERITGYTKDSILGTHCQNSPLRHIDGEGNLICIAGCPLHRTLMDGEGRNHEAFLKNHDGNRIPVSVNTIPVKEGDQTVGAIEIFTPSSLVIYDDELITQLSSSAIHDQLTGIPNRRRVESFLDLRLREMARYQSKLCVIFLDIDNFSNFNNTYGHDVGDAVLISVSQSIKRMIRSTDLFGRWGGEEFIGIFTIKNDSDALLIGEKMRVWVEETKIPHGDSALSVTASIGATVACAGDTIESIVKRADEKMYQSKMNGKNRVTADGE